MDEQQCFHLWKYPMYRMPGQKRRRWCGSCGEVQYLKEITPEHVEIWETSMKRVPQLTVLAGGKEQ